MKKNKILSITAIFTVIFLIFGFKGTLMALECPPWLPSYLCDAQGNILLDPNTVIRIALYLVIVAAIIWTLWNIIVAGFNWAASGGDEEKRGKATKQIISALVGLVIVAISFTILSLVVSLFTGSTQGLKLGIPCINDKGEAGLWIPEYDKNKNGEIDKDECQAVK